jgi:hypothetical protein
LTAPIINLDRAHPKDVVKVMAEVVEAQKQVGRRTQMVLSTITINIAKNSKLFNFLYCSLGLQLCAKSIGTNLENQNQLL